MTYFMKLEETPLAWMLGEFLYPLGLTQVTDIVRADLVVTDRTSLPLLPATETGLKDLVLVGDKTGEPDPAGYGRIEYLNVPFFTTTVNAVFLPLAQPPLRSLFPDWKAEEAAADFFGSREEYLSYLADFSNRYHQFASDPPAGREELRPVIHNLKSHAGFIGDEKLKAEASLLNERLKGGEEPDAGQLKRLLDRLADDCRLIGLLKAEIQR